MHSSRLLLVVGGAFILAILVLTIVFPELGDSSVWYAVVAVYGLTLILGGGAWYRRSRLLEFRETVGIAAVVVVVLVPLTPRLFVEWGNSTPSLLQYWSVALALHLQGFVPVAFMFPLGAARTRRQQSGTITLMLLPSMYELFDWFVLQPAQFDPHWTTPLTLVASTGFWFVVLAALGSLLFWLGRQLNRRNGPFEHLVRRGDTPQGG